MKLYDSLISANAYKVRLLLARLERAYERVDVDILAGEARTDAFRAKNVAHRVPLLELDDGTTLAESGAILALLAEGTPWLPDDPLERAQVLRWVFFEQNMIEPSIAVLRFIVRWGEADEAVRTWLHGRGVEGLRVLESHLADRPWLRGDHETIADLAVYGYTHVADEGGFDLEPFPAIRAWHARVAAHPSHFPITFAPA